MVDPREPEVLEWASAHRVEEALLGLVGVDRTRRDLLEQCSKGGDIHNRDVHMIATFDAGGFVDLSRPGQ
jgi:hypothetical protein